MSIDDLTIGELKQMLGMFGGKAERPAAKSDGPWVVGRKYLIRTVTMTLTGRLEAAYPNELVLVDAAWIADTGRFADALRAGTLSEVEPFPGGQVIVGRAAVIDAAEWAHDLPREQK